MDDQPNQMLNNVRLTMFHLSQSLHFFHGPGHFSKNSSILIKNRLLISNPWQADLSPQPQKPRASIETPIQDRRMGNQ